jgi:hypothetical protein
MDGRRKAEVASAPACERARRPFTFSEPPFFSYGTKKELNNRCVESIRRNRFIYYFLQFSYVHSIIALLVTKNIKFREKKTFVLCILVYGYVQIKYLIQNNVMVEDPFFQISGGAPKPITRDRAQGTPPAWRRPSFCTILVDIP